MTARTIDAVLFDLDGTLVDSFPAIHASVNDLRQLHHLAPMTLEQVRGCVGNGLHRLLELIVPTGDRDAQARHYTEHHLTVLATHSAVYPLVAETLATLQASGVRLAVCSNKPLELTERLLSAMNLTPMFAAVLGPESVPHRKPAPDMLLEACRMLNVSPTRAVYVGDMTIDIEAAHAAGIACWTVTTGGHSRDQLLAASPARVMDRFDELLELLRPVAAAS